jgi:CRISPR-associated endonuclease/helicase Cas3
MLTIERFAEFYRALHTYEPFPWQERLSRLVHQQGWPRLIDLPTGFGKTSTLEIAVYLAALGSPAARRRVFFVVDRRVVVDAASEMAERLSGRLAAAETGILKEAADALRALSSDSTGIPLRVFTLRGGIYRDAAWATDPLQAQICCTTVDQVGSALLFRGYSARSPYSWPIQAAMTAFDSLLLVDEAHLSRPFEQTAEIVQAHYLKCAAAGADRSMTLVSLTATAATDTENVFRHDTNDMEHAELRKRYCAGKSVSLETEKGDFESAAAAHANAFARKHSRVAVIVNRVDSARAIFEKLAAEEKYDVVLFTGRSRPYDRNRLAKRYLPILRSDRAEGDPEKPVIVVATQCLEAGADFDFDAMVTEAASWDALRQRWGRLNRMGKHAAAPCIAITRGAKEDPIYNDSLKETFDWIESRLPVKQSKQDFPVFDASPANLAQCEIAAEQLGKMLQPKKDAPVLLPAYLDHLVHTSPQPEIELDIPVFLHGPGSSPADVFVLWREGLEPDLPEDWAGQVSINPPCSAEMLSLPVWRVKSWLRGDSTERHVTDLEGQPFTEERPSKKQSSKQFLLWRGDESKVLERVEELRPGAVIVLPSSYGGCDDFGWNPKSMESVPDIGDEAAYELRRRPVLRLFDRPLAEEGIDLLKDRTERSEGRQQILELLRQTPSRLLKRVTSEDESGQARVIAVAGPRPSRAEIKTRPAETGMEQESDASSFTAESGVALVNHLEDVAARARLYCEKLGLESGLALAVETAAQFHDIGKTDPRFQALLRQIPRWAVKPEGALAKSQQTFAPPAAYRRAREQAGYPQGARHEVLSAAMLAGAMGAGSWAPPQGCDADLVLHLVASHHGRCRPFAPYVEDTDPEMAEFTRGGVRFRHQTNHSLADWGSGVADRFWKLHGLFGWYGVAYLETLLRLADQRVSEEGK